MTITDRVTGTSVVGSTTDRNTGTAALLAIKAPCVAIASSPITLAAEQTVSGVACVAGDRVLVAGQADATLNGIYVVSSGDWQRAPDFNANGDLLSYLMVAVSGGTGSGVYLLASPNPVVLGTSNITFVNLTGIIDALALLSGNNLADVASAIASIDNLSTIGANIAAAATLDLEAATGDFLTVTGDTGISAVTLAEGHGRWVVFTGTPTITVGASLVGNGGGENIVIEAGDVAYFRGLAGGVVRFLVIRASGAGLSSSGGSGLQAEWFPAHAFYPRVTNGPSVGLVELSTNDVMLPTLDFSSSTEEGATSAPFVFKKRWNLGTITAKVLWTAASGSGTVTWRIDGFAAGNDDGLDRAFGTSQAVTDTLITANDVHTTDLTSAITLAGTPQDEDVIVLRIRRDIADTLGVDAKLIGVLIYYTADQGNDE